ncbi:hypothetical protein KO465_01065 [Candidatus Micrarchaeota archaeon]|jgi:hypothetical protein|nr:hypothetical protein [Candidatus Micrarchaeota archaeon]
MLKASEPPKINYSSKRKATIYFSALLLTVPPLFPSSSLSTLSTIPSDLVWEQDSTKYNLSLDLLTGDLLISNSTFNELSDYVFGKTNCKFEDGSGYENYQKILKKHKKLILFYCALCEQKSQDTTLAFLERKDILHSAAVFYKDLGILENSSEYSKKADECFKKARKVLEDLMQ